MADCRAITFFNYHIPMASDIKREDIQYITMGFFDGMLTEKFALSDVDWNEKNLWKYELHRTAESEGKYSYQNVACIVCDEKSEFTDEELWMDETDFKFPLSFVTFLQLEDYISDRDTIDQKRLEFDNQVKEIINNGMYYTYKTVDKNDFVVCIKCQNYHQAVQAVKHLHQTEGCNIIYSYTVFSVSRKVLDFLTKEIYPQIFDEKIESICLKGIVNSSHQDSNIILDKKYRKYGHMLINKLYQGEENSGDAKIYDILGDNDFRLIARKVSLGKILCEFKKEGLLDYHGKVFPKYLFSSSLVLNTEECGTQREINSDFDEYTAAESAEQYATGYGNFCNP